MKSDCLEFLQSLLEHFWKEQPQLKTVDEKEFGGLSQDSIKCKCCYSHEILIQKMAEILPIQLIVYTIQSCIEAFFFSEEVDWRCPNCELEKCLKSVEVICLPSSSFTYCS